MHTSLNRFGRLHRNCALGIYQVYHKSDLLLQYPCNNNGKSVLFSLTSLGVRRGGWWACSQARFVLTCETVKWICDQPKLVKSLPISILVF